MVDVGPKLQKTEEVRMEEDTRTVGVIGVSVEWPYGT